MRAHGVPPAVVMYINQAEMQTSIVAHTAAISTISTSLSVLGENIQNQLNTMRSEVPQRVAEHIAESFLIEGQPITQNEWYRFDVKAKI